VVALLLPAGHIGHDVAVHRGGPVAIALLLGVTATACDDGGRSPTGASADDADTTAFCDEWNGALPDGYQEVLSGDRAVTSLVFPPSPLYWLRYQGDGGLLDVSGLQMSESEFEAFRFFTLGVDQGEVAGYDGLVGNAWGAHGPAVVTWREPDGLVVRIVGTGVPLETARDVAEQARDLTDDEWADLVEAEDTCEDIAPVD
jgi:hypothetical protein